MNYALCRKDATSSVFVYTMVEMAKVNELNVYKYHFEHRNQDVVEI